MSDIVKTVFQEYTRLRLNGLDAGEAIRALHSHVNELDDELRDELARNMRAWENQRTEKISLVDRKTLKKAAQARDSVETINCPQCGKKNTLKETICYSCGTLLSPATANSTAVLVPKTDELGLINDAEFHENHVLVLVPSDDETAYNLRPQLGIGRLSVGRAVDGQDDIDVDLERLNASSYGVSRMHAAFIYDDITHTVLITDMGSTNGTFINGQKLHANERRTLRHGDELRFGRLMMRVFYKPEAI